MVNINYMHIIIIDNNFSFCNAARDSVYRIIVPVNEMF